MQFTSNYDSRVVILEHKMFIRLATRTKGHLVPVNGIVNFIKLCYHLI